MPRGRVVFVVEGHLEHEFLNKTCSGSVIVLRLSNGKSVTAQALAKQVYAQVMAISHEVSYIAVVADREKRVDSSEKIEKDVSDALNKTYKLKIPFSVHVPDLMIENWIISDINTLKKFKLDVDLSKGTEGCHGKSRLDDAYRKKKLKYKELDHGVPLLRSCSAIMVNDVSPSFSRFFCKVKSVMPNWYWLKR